MSRNLGEDDLLAIFDPDPRRASEKCSELFQRLVRYFEWNRALEPEDMAQETLRRGLERLQEGQKISTTDPASYFLGIAWNLVREGWKRRKEDQLADREPPVPRSSFRNLNHAEQAIFLEECLRELPKEDFGALMAYAAGSSEDWGRKHGLQPGAVRLRIHRIRQRLESLANAKASARRPKKTRNKPATSSIL